MKDLRMMIGLPRSGKSTIVSRLQGESVILCADTLRYLVYGQRFDRNCESLMWSIHNIVFNMLVNQGVDIIIDETNVMPERRANYISTAKEHGYNVEAIWVNTPKSICIRRAIESGQDDVVHVIERMELKFVEPSKEEGFTNITKICAIDEE